MNEDQTIHELLLMVYPRASVLVSPLRELVKTNPELLEEVIELSIMIGVNAAMQRLEWDKKEEKVEYLRKKMGLSPAWGYNDPE